MNIGFTGTQKGMSPRQLEALGALLLHLDEGLHEFHHGDCIGADKEAHELVQAIAPDDIDIYIHPSNIRSKRAYCEGAYGKGAVTVFDEKPPLDRNHEIVDDVNILIAAPETIVEQLRSGTWATIRYARIHKIPVIILDR